MLDPDLPQNGGVSRRLHLVVPSGSVVAASFPTPVGAGNVEASQRIVDVLLGAMAQLVPEQAAGADQGTMNNLLIGGADGDGRPFVYYETIAGGQGGRPSGPGQSGIHTGMTNTANTPIEALEAGFPLRVLRYGLVEGSGGVGAQPGGDGIERAVQVLTPTIVSLLGERRQVPPWGIDGGQPGACGDDVVLRADGRHEPVGAKAVLHLAPGDTIVVRTPGGGGRGPAPPPPP
jgi:N-methylhydantoinase B/oxoprolinase/acetone carboxylase alpha subunit